VPLCSAAGWRHGFLQSRLISDALKEWREAYGRSGKGSASVRARNIRDIYDAAAPLTDRIDSNEAQQFLAGMRHIVHEAIKAAGGEVRISLSA